MEPGLDGVMQVLEVDGDDVHVAIVNPDGSLAEMSGNGTRIAAAWLMDRTGSDVARVHVGPLTVDVRRVGDRLYESDMGDGRGATSARRVAGSSVTPVSVGNPHAVVVGDPADLPLIGPLLETHPRFPNRTNVQVVRIDGPGEVTARVWERGVGETTRVRARARSPSRRRRTAKATCSCTSRAATSACACTRAAPRSPALRSPRSARGSRASRRARRPQQAAPPTRRTRW